tara:strand:- start:401 stop:961 length:561 start_codon:yes stop_codon:yes gene_type:complete
MGLMLETGGTGQPYIDYKSSKKGFIKSSPEGKVDFDFTKAVFDLANIKTGWCKFVMNTPEWVWDDSIDKIAKKPKGDDWKRGFEVMVYSESMFGDEPVRKFSSSAAGAGKGMAELYAEYEKVKADGKSPVVVFEGTKHETFGKQGGTNTSEVPILKIEKMIDTPSALRQEDASVVDDSDLDEFARS